MSVCNGAAATRGWVFFSVALGKSKKLIKIDILGWNDGIVSAVALVKRRGNAKKREQQSWQ